MTTHRSTLPPVPAWHSMYEGRYGQPDSKTWRKARAEVMAREAAPHTARHALHNSADGVVSLLKLRGAWTIALPIPHVGIKAAMLPHYPGRAAITA